MIPRATYRLQLHKDFTFADATAQAEYFANLGISHVYTSPILAARAGSKHGYDVIDHGRINPELGGESGFRALAASLKARGIGLIVDIVPNHMAVGKADNPWWQDLLQNGPQSAYAGAFDIDWDTPGLEGKVFAPFLDGPSEGLLANGELKLIRESEQWAFAYFEHRFPLRPEDQQGDYSGASPQALAGLLASQHFRLADWRKADSHINWRRFFDITDLAAIRVGEPSVFRAVHKKIFSLYAEGLIDGVRVDHIDGLADPASYCRLLRQSLTTLRKDPYIVVEKILADDEALCGEWQVDGTTGYDFMNEISAALHVEDGGALEALWARYGRRGLAFEDEERLARHEILTTKFAAQWQATARAFAKLIPEPPETLAAALAAMIVELRCYRDYATGKPDSPEPGSRFQTAVQRARKAEPGLALSIDAVAGTFSDRRGEPLVVDALRRFHQLSAPVAAKAVEDTAFYRYGRLLSRNDVGFDPRLHRLDRADFHARMTRRAGAVPHCMLATATHDHKRGEDARVRLAGLSQIPQHWADFVADVKMPAALHSGDIYQLLQTLVGAWPAKAAGNAFADRIGDWCEKYLREAKLRSNWADPDTAYEQILQDYARFLIVDAEAEGFRARLATFLDKLAPIATANSLIQTVLHYTLPGVPDLYQGCEAVDLSLVDPDNRRPVDFKVRARQLAAPADPDLTDPLSREKQRMIGLLLAARRADPDLWAFGNYRPLPADGSDKTIAFARHHKDSVLLVVALRAPGSGDPSAVIPLERAATDLFSGAKIAPGKKLLSDLLAGRPAAVFYGQR
jgi:(1->4)-alpha-D-glucan 1-alpha-D-glucosylmutase